MKIRIIIILYSFTLSLSLNANNLNFFILYDLGEIKNKKVAFTSLSDIYPVYEKPDTLVMPDLSLIGIDDSMQYSYLILSSKYRNQFLSETNILESDKVFVYSYSKNILISFPVSSLNVVVHLNFYVRPEECPCPAYYYMFGFEIDKKYLEDFDSNYINTLVYVGKESPFIFHQMKPIIWKKIEGEHFPISTNDSSIINTLNYYNYNSEYNKGNTYVFKDHNLQYYVQNILWNKENNRLIARHLMVMDKKTKKYIRSVVFIDGESSSPAPLNNIDSEYVVQWTGKLIKNKPPVILGLEYSTFGCPRIIFLNPNENDIYINCDNRH